MCGLSGIAGTIEQKHDPVFRDMLFLNSLRGTDSTGVGGVYRDWKNHEPTWIKTLGGGWEMLDDKKFDKFLKYYFCCLLGHNRSATAGMVSMKNAHPFMHSGPYSKCIIGMHNGTLDNMAKYDLKDDAQFATDSEAIINNIAFEGPEKTLPKLSGAWALVWYDWERHTINMIRNDKRPLSFVLSKDEKTLFWGSDLCLLGASLGCRAAPYFRQAQEVGQYFILPENVLYSWRIPERDKAFDSPIETKLEGKKSFTFQGQGNTWIDKDGNKHPFVVGKTSNAYDIKSKFVGAANANPTSTSGTSTKTYTQSTSGQKSTFKGLCGISPFQGLKDFGVHGGTTVLYDPKNDSWIQAKYDAKTQQFDPNLVTHTRFPPQYLPYSELDINGNHAFKHIGKKKKKQIFFRGWNDVLLSREQTESAFSFGCIGCGRQPHWGNTVFWCSPEHDFLCEFCSESEGQRATWKEAS